MKKKKNLLLDILKTNEKIFKKQQLLVNRYELLSEQQKKEEKLNKITRYLALGFILVRIFVFCLSLSKTPLSINSFFILFFRV